MPVGYARKGIQMISESTALPISLVLVAASGIFFIASIWAQGNANASALKELQDDRKVKREEFLDIVKRFEHKIDSVVTDVAYLKGKAGGATAKAGK